MSIGHHESIIELQFNVQVKILICKMKCLRAVPQLIVWECQTAALINLNAWWVHNHLKIVHGGSTIQFNFVHGGVSLSLEIHKNFSNNDL